VVKSTNYEAPHYAVFTVPLSLHPSQVHLRTNCRVNFTDRKLTASLCYGKLEENRDGTILPQSILGLEHLFSPSAEKMPRRRLVNGVIYFHTPFAAEPTSPDGALRYCACSFLSFFIRIDRMQVMSRRTSLSMLLLLHHNSHSV
jgi:hypothetical protein